MNILIMVMSVICFIFSVFGLASNVNGTNILGVMVVKAISLMGTLFPILYWLMLGGILKQ